MSNNHSEEEASASASAAKEILSTILDDKNLRIMKVLEGKEMNIQQISQASGIPLSSTYRKIGKLEQLQLIKKTKVIRRLDGLDETFYILWVEKIDLTYNRNRISYRIKHKPLEDKIVRLWQKFKV
ncbi:MAG: helix-turn-helix domain-containing protein [Candidatus Nitrosocosmicus sp.]